MTPPHRPGRSVSAHGRSGARPHPLARPRTIRRAGRTRRCDHPAARSLAGRHRHRGLCRAERRAHGREQGIGHADYADGAVAKAATRRDGLLLRKAGSRDPAGPSAGFAEGRDTSLPLPPTEQGVIRIALDARQVIRPRSPRCACDRRGMLLPSPSGAGRRDSPSDNSPAVQPIRAATSALRSASGRAP
jgi:hypothetical protein